MSITRFAPTRQPYRVSDKDRHRWRPISRTARHQRDGVNPRPLEGKDRALQDAETRYSDCTLSRDQHYAIRDHATLRIASTASHWRSDESSRIRASTPQGILISRARPKSFAATIRAFSSPSFGAPSGTGRTLRLRAACASSSGGYAPFHRRSKRSCPTGNRSGGTTSRPNRRSRNG